jgi:hypothetical protein
MEHVLDSVYATGEIKLGGRFTKVHLLRCERGVSAYCPEYKLVALGRDADRALFEIKTQFGVGRGEPELNVTNPKVYRQPHFFLEESCQ